MPSPHATPSLSHTHTHTRQCGLFVMQNDLPHHANVSHSRFWCRMTPPSPQTHTHSHISPCQHQSWWAPDAGPPPPPPTPTHTHTLSHHANISQGRLLVQHDYPPLHTHTHTHYLTMPTSVMVGSWCRMTASVVRWPSSASSSCWAVQLWRSSSTLYQLSGYQPMINHTYFLPYSFSLYAWG